MNVTLAEAIVIYARACRKWFGRKAIRKDPKGASNNLGGLATCRGGYSSPPSGLRLQ